MCSSLFFFFKQKTAYEMRISDWSSDVCSSDLERDVRKGAGPGRRTVQGADERAARPAIRPACRGHRPGRLRQAARHSGGSGEAMPGRQRRRRKARSEGRREGKEWLSTGRSRLSPDHYKKKNKKYVIKKQ